MNTDTSIVLKSSFKERAFNFLMTLLAIAILTMPWYVRVNATPLTTILWMIMFSILAILSLKSFIGSFTVATVQENVILYHRFFEEVQYVQIPYISRVFHGFWNNTMTLVVGDQLIVINQAAQRFVEFFDLLRDRRPDLWPLPSQSQFRIQPILLFTLFTPALVIVGLVLALAIQRPLPLKELALAPFSLLLLIIAVRRRVIGLSLSSDALEFEFPFDRRVIPSSNISSIVLTLPGQGEATQYSLTIQFGEKRGFIVHGFDVHEVLIWDKLSAIMPSKVIRATVVESRSKQARKQ